MESKSPVANVAVASSELTAPTVVARVDASPSRAPTTDVVWSAPWLPAACVLAPILALFALYALQHLWLCDDAYISFRYARNLALGRGLVFNLGERVEGYTNFLWVLELAGAWKLLGARPEISSCVLSALYTAGTLWVTGLLASRTPFRQQRLAAIGCALALLAVNRTFVLWTFGGLETRQFTFFAVLAIYLMQYSQRSDPLQAYVPASLAWAGAALTRPEGLLLFACAGLWLLGHSAAQRQIRALPWAGFVLPFALIVGAHFAFRALYYGDLLPNTYYAKDVRAWPEAGFRYFAEACIENGLYLLIPIAALGLFARLTLTRDSLHVLSAICITLHIAYVVRIGGDYFEFRPLDFYWPLLAVAVADALLLLRAVSEHLFAGLKRHARLCSWFAAGAAALVITLYSTVLQLGHLTLTHDLHTRAEVAALAAEITEQSFPAAFVLPGMETLASAYNASVRFTSKHRIAVRYQEHLEFWQNAVNLYGAYIGKTDNVFPASAVMRFDAVGVVPYSLPDLTIIDTFGLTDRTVARNPVTARNKDRSLAHDRSPPPGYLERRGVNLDVLASDQHFGPAAEYALQLEERLWMPLRSTRPEWLRDAFAGRALWWKHLEPELAANRVWVAGLPLTATRALGFFDGQDEGWVAAGADMRVDAARMPPHYAAPWGNIGTGLIDSYEPTSLDHATGSLTSPVFTPVAGDHLTFLVGGGSSQNVGVALVVDGASVASWRGEDNEVLRFVAVDLTRYAGRSCQVHIYDAETAGWGHILADHFLLSASQPR